MPTIETNSAPTCLDGICVHCAPRPHIFVVLMCQANKPKQSKKHGFPVPLPGYPSFPGHMSWRFLKGIGPCHHHPIWQFGSGLLELLPLWWNFLSVSCCPSSCARAAVGLPSHLLMFSPHRKDHNSACGVPLLSLSGSDLHLVPEPLIYIAEIWRMPSLNSSLSFL